MQINVPLNNQKGPLAAEQLFQSLHGILQKKIKSNEHYSLEIVAVPTGIYFLIICNKRYQLFVENQIYSQYPTS